MRVMWSCRRPHCPRLCAGSAWSGGEHGQHQRDGKRYPTDQADPAVFAHRSFPWIAPVTVLVMVGLNASYFSAMQGLGEPLTLSKDGFRWGVRGKERSVRWIHVTDLVGARLGAFSGMRMSEAGEWQDPKLRPNVIFFRLNRALVHSRKSLLQRIRGFSYYDGAIRNAFGVPTEQL